MPEERCFYTLLFLDIPTALQVRDMQGNDEAARFLGEVTGRLDRIRRQHAGQEVRTVGSTMLSRFEDAAAALRAACEMRTVMSSSRVAGTQPVLRIGVHAGEVTVHGRSFYGEAVSTSARLVTLCSPGQILASRAVRDLLPEASRRALRRVETPREWAAPIGELFEAVPESELAGSEVVAAALSQAMRTNTRTLDDTAAAAGLPVQLTPLHRKRHDTARPPDAADAAAVDAGARLCLVQGRSILIVDSRTPAVSLGREEGNDITVNVATASRRHAHVEWRDSGFFLVDHSWNGTYVYDPKGVETHVHNAEFRLCDSGLICPGCPGAHAEAEAIRYVEAR